MYTTIITLYKQGNSERKISKLTKTHRSTVKKIVQRYLLDRTEVPISYSRKSEISSWHEKITELLATKLSVVRIFEKLKEDGFNKSYNSLSLYIRKHNIKNKSYNFPFKLFFDLFGKKDNILPITPIYIYRHLIGFGFLRIYFTNILLSLELYIIKSIIYCILNCLLI